MAFYLIRWIRREILLAKPKEKILSVRFQRTLSVRVVRTGQYTDCSTDTDWYWFSGPNILVQSVVRKISTTYRTEKTGRKFVPRSGPKNPDWKSVPQTESDQLRTGGPKISARSTRSVWRSGTTMFFEPITAVVIFNLLFLFILYSTDHTLRHQATFTLRRILGYHEENVIYEKVIQGKAIGMK